VKQFRDPAGDSWTTECKQISRNFLRPIFACSKHHGVKLRILTAFVPFLVDESQVKGTKGHLYPSEQKFGKNETSLAQARLLAEITQKKDKFFSRHVWGTCDHSMWFETTVDCDAPSAPLHITLMIHSPFVPENFVELLHMFQNCLVQIWIFYDLVILNTVSLTAFQIDI